jgi:hypothetical protein
MSGDSHHDMAAAPIADDYQVADGHLIVEAPKTRTTEMCVVQI